MTRRLPYFGNLFMMWASNENMGKGYIFSINDIQKGSLFCQNGIHLGKGYDLGTEPPCVELCRVPPPPHPPVEG